MQMVTFPLIFYDNDKSCSWMTQFPKTKNFYHVFLFHRTMRHHRKMQMAVLVIGSAWTPINHVARRMKITSTRFCGGRVSSLACKIFLIYILKLLNMTTTTFVTNCMNKHLFRFLSTRLVLQALQYNTFLTPNKIFFHLLSFPTFISCANS